MIDSTYASRGARQANIIGSLREREGQGRVILETEIGGERVLTVAAVAGDAPHLYAASLAKKDRRGRVFIDYLRNGRGATYVTALSTRRRPGAPVSTPLRWEELSPKLKPNQYTVANMRRRLAGLKDDPWRGFSEVRQAISDDMLLAVGVQLRKSA